MKKFMKTVAIALLAYSVSALATHVPDPTEVIDYDGTLAPLDPAAGSIGWSSPNDGYDWYCIDVTSGQEVSLTASRTSGDILPNLGASQGLAFPGGVYGDLPGITNTGNSTLDNVNMNFTPGFTGPVTIYVSTWLNENGGTYDLEVSGASAHQGGCIEYTTPVPANDPVALAILAALLGLVALVRIRTLAA